MGGGLMNLVSAGQENIILNGNPSKTFFKASYTKYTNFGLQQFRVDFEGTKTLQLTTESHFTFKIPRYGDLIMDCYLVLNLPNIWSPIMPPIQTPDSIENNSGQWVPYEFKWIDYIGVLMISKVTITCGNQTLQEFSGNYILSSFQRDVGTAKGDLFGTMIGNVPEVTDPGNSGANVNSYPNAYYTNNPAGAEPSIRARTIYIPINAWFNLKSQNAFPLVALQYNELHINITMRPLQELFVIRDVFDSVNNFPYVAPNFNLWYMQMYRFLQTPPDIELGVNSYTDTRSLWNADIHLNCTYCFLSNDERRAFAMSEQKYLIRQVREMIYYNVTGPNKVEVNSLGLTLGYMFYFQRSDANLRNQWTNYTNWPYDYLPQSVSQAPTAGDYPIVYTNPVTGLQTDLTIGPGVNPNQLLTGWVITGDYNFQNIKEIMTTFAIVIDGEYRENLLEPGVYDYIQKYNKTSGNLPEYYYCYNFCLSTDWIGGSQPCGAINMSRFNKIEFEFSTIIPSLDPLAQQISICDPISGEIIGINKSSWRIYEYNYNLIVFEERINQVLISGGNAGLLYAL